MIEKIMKAVKSGNKKRGRNITIGAVVGMLLSCTVAMGGTNVTGLEITKEGDGSITFTPSIDKDIYPENTWDEASKTYTNNTVISGESADGNGTGIKINAADVTIENNGIISGTTDSTNSRSYGIDLSGSKNNIINSGIISSNSSKGYEYRTGINISSGASMEDIKNKGVISSSTDGGNATTFGIHVEGSVNDIENNGLINSNITDPSSSYSYGIYVYGGGSIGNIKNNGLINSNSSSGNGVFVQGSGTIEKLENSGVIYGNGNAISKDNEKGTISNANNYGLLVSGDTSQNVVYKLVEIVAHDDTSGGGDKIKNYGLAFTADSSSGKYIGVGSEKDSTVDYHNSFGTKKTDGEYIIINAKNNGAVDDIKTESMELKNGALPYGNSETEVISPDKKYILNGIEDTLKISGRKNELNNSTVNAYTTAVVMDENTSMLTLDNTIVNGGVADGSTTVNITGEGNNFTAKGNSVINVRDEGIAITVDGDDNAVVLKGNAIVNGKMEANGDRNILDLDGTGKDGMNMHHDISGFAKMAIDNNVIFSEDMTVTGTTEVTVEETGVLSLRLKKEVSPKATHAFSGRTGKHEMTIEGSGEGGTLNFITNGIGRVIDVDMEKIKLENMKIKASSIIDKAEIHEDFIRLGAGSDLDGIVNPKEVKRYDQLNKIYKSIYSSREENIDGLRDILDVIFLGENYDYNNGADEEQLANLLSYLGSIYTEAPYSFSSELSRRSMGMFRDIVTENEFRPNQDNWLIMGGLTHTDGGTKDTYYGRNYHGFDTGSSDTDADMKLTGAYMLAKYGYSENLSLGVTLGGNKSEAEMSTSKVKGNSGYLGAFAENYRGNLTLKAGAGVQYSEYDADRSTLRGHSYSDKYSDMTYDIYLNGRYSHQVGDNLFLEPYATLSYTYVDQDGANEGNKTLAIETDSKSFDYTVGKVGVDLKKVIPHEKGKSTLTAGVSYTKILDGADEEHITGRFKGGSDFDILVAHKNEQSIGLNAKYALELENGVVFDVKGSYSVEEDSHNSSSKNKSKGEWIVGAGIGYKF